jgi:hypothetical protein
MDVLTRARLKGYSLLCGFMLVIFLAVAARSNNHVTPHEFGAIILLALAGLFSMGIVLRRQNLNNPELREIISKIPTKPVKKMATHPTNLAPPYHGCHHVLSTDLWEPHYIGTTDPSPYSRKPRKSCDHLAIH